MTLTYHWHTFELGKLDWNSALFVDKLVDRVAYGTGSAIAHLGPLLVLLVYPAPTRLSLQLEVTARLDRHTLSHARPGHTTTFLVPLILRIVRTVPPASTAPERTTLLQPGLALPVTIVQGVPLPLPNTLWRLDTTPLPEQVSSTRARQGHGIARRV